MYAAHVLELATNLEQSMRVLVIGAGMMGSAIAYDLAHSDGVSEIHLADVDAQRASSVAASLGKKVRDHKLDVGMYDDVVEAMQQVDAAIGATSYTHNYLLAKAAIEAGIHFCDLGGNMDVVYRQMSLNEKAKAAKSCVVPNCGLAPGLACVVTAGGARKF